MEDEAREMRWDLLMLVGDGGYGGDSGVDWDVRVFISSFWGMEGKETDQKEKVGERRTRPLIPHRVHQVPFTALQHRRISVNPPEIFLTVR